MDDAEDLVLFIDADAHAFEGFSRAAVGADQRAVVAAGKGRSIGVGASALGAFAWFVYSVFHFYSSYVVGGVPPEGGRLSFFGSLGVAEYLIGAARFCVSAVPDRKEHFLVGFGNLDAVGDLPCPNVVQHLGGGFEEVGGNLSGRAVLCDQAYSVAAKAFNMFLAGHVQDSFALFSLAVVTY